MHGILADENFNEDLLRQLIPKIPDVMVLRAEEVGLRRTADEVVLQWAAERDLVVISHDVQTMVGHAYDRVAHGLLMPGFVIVPWRLSIGVSLRDLETLITLLPSDQWTNQVRYVPLSPGG